VLGYLVYRRSVSINLARFFRYTGAGLVVVAAGVLAYGFHDLMEAGYFAFGGLNHVAFDATGILPPSSWWGSLWKGLFSLSPTPFRLELGVWLAYLVPTLVLFLRPPKPSAPPPTPATGTAPASVPVTQSSGSVR